MNLMNSAAASAPADDDHGLSPLKSNHPASNFINSSNSFVTGSSDSSSFHEPMASNSWMTESVWAPPNLLSIIAGQELEDFPPPPQAMATPSASHQRCFEENNCDNIGVHNSGGGCSLYNDELVISRDLKRPSPIGRQEQQQQNQQHQQQLLLVGTGNWNIGLGSPILSQEQQHYPQPQMNSSAAESVDPVYQQLPPPFRRESGDRHYRLIVLKQPEEQHRARYASEGSRGAIKDRAGTSFCAIQLFGYYRPTRVELFAAERNFQHGRPAFVQHSQYKLIPVAGKSSTITPCKRITAEDGSERLEVILRPENRMIGILDSIGIMKICSYVSSEGKRPKRRKQRKMCGGDDSAEDQQSNNDGLPQNSVHIVCRAFIPLNDESDCGERITRFEVLQAVTEPIRCVQQLGTPDLLKMSLESSPSLGGQELFLIGRNFDPKDTKILFREYRNDGSLGWSAEAVIDRRFLHQCHIVCVVPAYHNIYSNATVSVTVICGTKQSHPKSFTYTACEREDDDDWRPPDCSNASDFQGAGSSSSKSQQKAILIHHHQQQQQQQFSGSHLFGGESFGRDGQSLSLATNNAEQRGPSQHYQHF